MKLCTNLVHNPGFYRGPIIVVRTVLFNAPVLAKAWSVQKESNNTKLKRHNMNDNTNKFINFCQRNDDLDAYLKYKYPDIYI